MSEAKFLKLWGDTVSSVAALASDESARTEAAFLQFEGGLLNGGIFKLPPASAKTWQKLVLEKKVPMHLGRACCQLLDTAWPHAVYAAIRPLYVLLQAASAAGTVSDVTDLASSSRPKSRIALSIGQQLKESGMLHHIPAVVTTTARRLQEAAGVTAAAVAGGSAQSSSTFRTPAQDSQCAAAAQRTASSTVSRPVLTTAEAEELDVTAELSKILCYQLSLLWNEADYYRNIGPSTVQPLGHLAVTLMQYLSADLQQAQGAGRAPTARHVGLLNCASACAHNFASCGVMGQDHGAEGIEHWLDCQTGVPNYLLLCVCMITTLAAIRGSLPPNLASISTSSSSSGRDGGSRDSEAALMRHMSSLWQRCCSMTDAVPESCAAMLRLLSCSKETALWAATQDDAEGERQRAVDMAQSLMHVACTAQLQTTAAQQQHSNSQAVQSMLPFYWQLPAVALLWASQHPTGTVKQDTQYVLASNTAVRMASAAMYHALGLQHVAHGYQLSSGTQLINEGGSRAPLPAVFLDVVQPLQCQILSQLLQLQRAAVAGAAGTSAQGSSSSSNRGALPQTLDARAWSFNTQVSSSAQYSADAQLPLTAVVDIAASNLHMMVQHTMRPDATPGGQVGAARQLCPAFEDMVRGQFEAFAASFSGGRVTGVISAFCLTGMPGLLNGEMGGWTAGPLVDPVTELAEPKALQLFGLLCSMLKAAGDCKVMQLLDAVTAMNMQQLGGTELAPVAWQYAGVALVVAGWVLGGVLNKHGVSADLGAARTLHRAAKASVHAPQ